MADGFDQFLASSLAPAERAPDRRFVARVQARIMLEEQLARERRALVAGLAKQLAALIAVAAAVWVIGSAAPVAQSFAEFPGIGRLLLLAAFGFVVAMFSRSGRPALRPLVAS
jgi:hypothetical protein